MAICIVTLGPSTRGEVTSYTLKPNRTANFGSPVSWFSSLLWLGLSCVAKELDHQRPAPSLDVPSHFPPVPALEDWTPSQESVLLGRWLFYDVRLSKDATRSCGICHEQEKAFTDGLVRSIGINNTPLSRNALSLVNVAWRTELTWSGQFPDVATHMSDPLFTAEPVEMGMTEALLKQRLTNSDIYPALFAQAFPDDDDPITANNAIRAIADFTRTIISGDSPYDRWLQGDNTLNESALRGMDLFYGSKMNCAACHDGLFFDAPAADVLSEQRHGYFNTGQYDIDGLGSYPPHSSGLFEQTGQPEDTGRFRTPSLRNLTATYPWSHDGTHLTLADRLADYARGGRKLDSGPHQGDGRDNPYKSDLITGFEMTEGEGQDLLSFLQALDDDHLLVAPDLATPFCVTRRGVVINEPCEPPFSLD